MLLCREARTSHSEGMFRYFFFIRGDRNCLLRSVSIEAVMLSIRNLRSIRIEAEMLAIRTFNCTRVLPIC